MATVLPPSSVRTISRHRKALEELAAGQGGSGRVLFDEIIDFAGNVDPSVTFFTVPGGDAASFLLVRFAVVEALVGGGTTDAVTLLNESDIDMLGGIGIPYLALPKNSKSYYTAAQPMAPLAIAFTTFATILKIAAWNSGGGSGDTPISSGKLRVVFYYDVQPGVLPDVP
jgi:hypothetical protein